MRKQKTAFETFFLFFLVGEGTFLIGGGGGGGASEGRVISKIFLQIGEGQTCFVQSWGRVTLFSVRKKITPWRFYKVDFFILFASLHTASPSEI